MFTSLIIILPHTTFLHCCYCCFETEQVGHVRLMVTNLYAVGTGRCHQRACPHQVWPIILQERKEPLAQIFIGYELILNWDHWLNHLHGESHLSTCLCEKTWDAHEPFERGLGTGFFINGSAERDASTSASTCVTKHACLWLTGWKRLSWRAPFSLWHSIKA